MTYTTQWLNQLASTWIPPFDFLGGDYVWYVQGWGPSIGYTDWSGPYSFTVEACVPEELSIVGPSEVGQYAFMSYEWEADPCATWYQLWVNKDGSSWYNEWHETGEVTGTITQDVSFHTLGNYEWWVRGYSPDGNGPWTSTSSFDIGKVTHVAPTGSGSRNRA